MTGSFFYLLGLFFVLRAIGLGKLSILRTHTFFRLFEPLAFMIGGILYCFGEIVLMQIEIGHWAMSTSQHVIMSLSLTLLGSFYFLYICRQLPGTIWAFTPGFLWCVLAILWLLHPQKNDYFQFGHRSIGTMFLITAVSRCCEAALALYSNAQHHRAIAQEQRRQVAPMTLRHISTHLHSMTSNEYIFHTPFPFLSGVVLMVIGTWDWQLAVFFWQGLEHTQMDWMSAEGAWLVHILTNVTVVAFIWGMLGLWDRSRNAGSEPDEFLRTLDAHPIETYQDERSLLDEGDQQEYI